MKTYLNNLILSSIFIALCASCSGEQEPAADSGKMPMTFDCVLDGGSRATDTAFEKGDRIGVYVVKGGSLIQPVGNEVNNETFSFDGTKWTAARNVFWNEGTFDVYAYYPHIDNIIDTEECLFSVSEDQSTHAGYTSSDFVWASNMGVKASADPVALSFSHRLSKVVVSLEKGDGFAGDIPSDCEVFIHSTATEASIDLATGNTSAYFYSPTATIKAFKKDATTFEAIVVPQNITSRRPLVEVVTQGISYLMEGKISLHQGYSHHMTITLTKNPEQTKIEIGGSIGGWE